MAEKAELTVLNGAYKAMFDGDEIGDFTDGVTIRRTETTKPVETDSRGTSDFIVTDIAIEVELTTANWNIERDSKLLASTKRATLTGTGADALLSLGEANFGDIGLKYSDIAKELILTPLSEAATPKYSFPKAVFDGALEHPHKGRDEFVITLKFVILRDTDGFFYEYGKVV